MSGETDVAARLAGALAAELLRHRDVIELVDHEGVPDGNGDRFRYGCACGYERGVWTEREAIARLKQSWAEQEQHVAEATAGALLPVVRDLQAAARAAAWAEAERCIRCDHRLDVHLANGCALLVAETEDGDDVHCPCDRIESRADLGEVAARAHLPHHSTSGSTCWCDSPPDPAPAVEGIR